MPVHSISKSCDALQTGNKDRSTGGYPAAMGVSGEQGQRNAAETIAQTQEAERSGPRMSLRERIICRTRPSNNSHPDRPTGVGHRRAAMQHADE